MKYAASVFAGGIGGPQVLFRKVNEDGRTAVGSFFDLRIPPEIMSELGIECMRYAYHNGLITVEHKNTLIELADIMIDGRLSRGEP